MDSNNNESTKPMMLERLTSAPEVATAIKPIHVPRAACTYRVLGKDAADTNGNVKKVSDSKPKNLYYMDPNNNVDIV